MALPSSKNVPNPVPANMRVLLYGPPKIGKSTFAAQNPDALIMDCDNGRTKHLPCFRVDIDSWVTFGNLLKEIKEQKERKFKTIVIDNVANLYDMCRAEVCKKLGVSHESEDKAFGRAYDMVRTAFMSAQNFMSGLGMGIWMVGHSITKESKVGGQKRMVTTLNMPEKPAKLVMSLADVVCYMDYNEQGQRQLYLVPEDMLECGDATGRMGTPKNIPFTTESEAFAAFSMTKKEEVKK